MNSQDELIERLARFYREAGREVSSQPPAWVPGRSRASRWLQPALAESFDVADAALELGHAPNADRPGRRDVARQRRHFCSLRTRTGGRGD